MVKPTIFFSHSSKDSAVVAQIKKMFVQKTHGTIDVFVSSDGQSIRLGRNWVHEIEQALERTKIMFVFLSPNSINSGWIYFESGYCHSKGIEVIPIALSGVDLNTVRPPLSLLQGFNLISAGSLNNLLTTANSKFGTSHPESFVESEFDELLNLGNGHSKNRHEEWSFVNEGGITLSARDPSKLEEAAKVFGEVLLKTDPDSGAQMSKDSISFYGGSVSFQKGSSLSVHIKFHISVISAIAPAVEALIELLKPLEGGIYILLGANSTIVGTTSLLTSKLRGTSAQMESVGNRHLFRYGNLKYPSARFSGRIEFDYLNPRKGPSVADFLEILNIMKDRGIIS